MNPGISLKGLLLNMDFGYVQDTFDRALCQYVRTDDTSCMLIINLIQRALPKKESIESSSEVVKLEDITKLI